MIILFSDKFTLFLLQDIVQRLSEVTGELKTALGNNPDPWAKVSRLA